MPFPPGSTRVARISNWCSGARGEDGGGGAPARQQSEQRFAPSAVAEGDGECAEVVLLDAVAHAGAVRPYDGLAAEQQIGPDRRQVVPGGDREPDRAVDA